jgi:hypothetical protein
VTISGGGVAHAMGGFLDDFDPFLVAVPLAAAMLAAWGVGWWRGRRQAPETAEDPGIRFTDAALALLGLLLAFTFSMALSRHEQRRAMIVTESNAIGDLYTCASLLKEPTRSQLQEVIRAYAERKVDIGKNLQSESDLQERLQAFQKMHGQMTAVAAEALKEGTPIAVSLTNTLNNVTSSHASHLAAYRDRLPWSIVLLLYIGAAIPAFLMGLQQAKSARPHLSGTVCFILMVTSVTYVTLDLNQPRGGIITVSQEPMERLLLSIRP